MRATPKPEEKTTRTVILLDTDRQFDCAIEVEIMNFGRRISVAGRLYDHCSEAPDGTWEFEPMK